MQVVVIPVRNVIRAYQQAQCVKEADLIEFRLDFLEVWDLEGIQMLLQSITQNVILTLRKKNQGGHCDLKESERLARLRKLAALKPAYLDLELDIDIDFVEQLKSDFPRVKLIRSCHVFEHTPDDLDFLLAAMQHPAFDLFKLVTQARNGLEALRLMHWLQAQKTKNLICFAMGEAGTFSRIIAPIIGSVWTYSAVESPEAGQILFEDMCAIYGAKTINRKTQVYALLGDPIHRSIGHLVHNGLYQRKGINAVYVKIQIKAEQLSLFFEYAQDLPFVGFSVTMPLKHHVIKHLNALSSQCEKIKAANTIKREKTAWLGFNTDGVGALDAIERQGLVANKSILVLGAGGAARAIIDEAMQRGAKVSCANRTISHAETLAKDLGCDVAKGLKENGLGPYDILVNTIPSHLSVLGVFFDKAALSEVSLVMDCNYEPRETALLRQAKQHHCQSVYGIEMYVKQAIAQLAIWFGESYYHSAIEKELYQIVQKESAPAFTDMV